VELCAHGHLLAQDNSFGVIFVLFFFKDTNKMTSNVNGRARSGKLQAVWVLPGN
jgi:hypothetical protein